MSKLEFILEELKTLPPDRLERVADYVRRLGAGNQAERRAALLRSAGSLTEDEADELERIIEEGCEKIDERDW